MFIKTDPNIGPYMYTHCGVSWPSSPVHQTQVLLSEFGFESRPLTIIALSSRWDIKPCM